MVITKGERHMIKLQICQVPMICAILNELSDQGIELIDNKTLYAVVNTVNNLMEQFDAIQKQNAEDAEANDTYK